MRVCALYSGFLLCVCVRACSADWAEEAECGNDASPRKISLDGNAGGGESDDDDDGSDSGNWDSDGCEYWLVIVLNTSPFAAANVHECDR